ncbi:hypothetical protein F2Q69_00044617 [Brassica cretica]|uniref:Glycosyl transferase family 3 domain-containing protein n=1 Tax=Brassica cretica TaxID=69181 RepID=A0A8S9NAG7_BRACR|nr:hypothetical protein F2Q69_00044617 [Brassica cretica]
MASATSIVSGINPSRILTSFNSANDCRRINLTGVKTYPALTGRGYSSVGAVSSIRGNAKSSFPSSSRIYPRNLVFRAAPEALPSACENATASSVKSFNQLIESLIDRVDLSESETESSLEFLLNEANEALISAFLVLLRAKGETYEEIVGLARAMMKHARKVDGLVDAVDIVGTGGDGANTVNISTGSSILAAACGAKVAKQGNRSSSSACGSADVLEALGVVIDLGPEGIKRCVEESGIAFMMSPMYHPAMKIVGPVRKKLKIKTVFNVLGPMLNPARVSYAVVGVYHKNLDNRSVLMASATSIVSGINPSRILTSFNSADDCRRINLTGVKTYPALTRRGYSSVGAVSSIRGNAKSSFPSSSRIYPRNLVFRAAPEALPSACGNATASSVKSFNQLIESLIDRVDLSESETESSLEFLLNEANEALISAFMVLLRAKGETYEEIVGLARAMMKHARKVDGLVDAVDIVPFL